MRGPRPLAFFFSLYYCTQSWKGAQAARPRLHVNGPEYHVPPFLCQGCDYVSDMSKHFPVQEDPWIWFWIFPVLTLKRHWEMPANRQRVWNAILPSKGHFQPSSLNFPKHFALGHRVLYFHQGYAICYTFYFYITTHIPRIYIVEYSLIMWADYFRKS